MVCLLFSYFQGLFVNAFDLLFRVGPAIQAIFELGYELKEEFFYELTSEQYIQLEKEGKDLSKRWFTIIPKNPKNDTSKLLIDDDEVKTLMDAVRYKQFV